MALPAKALTGTAFATLLLIALMMGANHIAARDRIRQRRRRGDRGGVSQRDHGHWC